MLRELILKADNFLWERRLGVRTRQFDSDYAGDGEREHYGTLPYRALLRILRQADLQPKDVLADIGCGKGRVLCCAAGMPIAGMIGVELDRELCGSARDNLRRIRTGIPAQVIEGPVEEFDFRLANVFYLFNPFGAATMRNMLDRLKSTATNRPIKIIYANPIHDSVLAQCGWLERYMEFRPLPVLQPVVHVSFWRSKEQDRAANESTASKISSGAGAARA
jgi:hypothetical protein